MYNRVVLVGNLTRDIEVRYTQSGSAIASTGIATNRKFTTNGEKKEEVMFIDITFFGRTAEIANQYLKRGRQVLVDGRLKFDQWVAQDGTKRNKHSVIVEHLQMLGNKNENINTGGNGDYNNYYNQQSQNNSNNNYGQQKQTSVMDDQSIETPKIPEIDISENDIPF
jgi:single-strand DNA-binding protein